MPSTTPPSSKYPRTEDVGPLVCLLAYDGLCTFEFGIGVEVFGLPRPEFDPWYRFRTVAVDEGPLRATGGVTVEATHDLSALSEADLILVPGWRGVDAPVPEALVMALRAAHDRGARVASICSGVFVLAAAGLLDHRRATTHWRYVETLSERHPDIEVDADVLYIDDGSVLTSAGSAAGLDLCLHIVRSDWGARHANAVARRLVLHAHRDGGQRQFVQAPVPQGRGGRIAPLLDRILGGLAEDWPVARMADLAGLSPRTLTRRFHATVGDTPLGWLTSMRVAHAAMLLETTDATLTDIALASGFGSPESFRREFSRLKGLPPSRYRAAFG
ncbi:transcriptional regulator FtrA [Tropicimonas aquimaris]|uniref:Transcriptional regulator FtrA n=1 Tax=Tropicimonas aquimaris TaxID=914152 RepID=A0ABW3IWK2_9RHOB